jgi:hypothetical protein
MFEGETTITFSKEAGRLMMSQNVTAMFGIPLTVTDLRYDYEGLRVTFAPPDFLEANAKAAGDRIAAGYAPVAEPNDVAVEE